MKASKVTKEIVESSKYKDYPEDELTDNFKGRIVVVNPEQSEIAKNLKINKKGNYAIRVG
jgi:RNA polymerase subunit RPABC4/transcription elongation factor Spt4